MNNKIIHSSTESYDYYSLWKYSEKDINIVDCLSYFIENSINLCKSNYWDRNTNYDLEIEITYSKEKNTYLIVDNSGGFNQYDLINVISNKLNHSAKMYDYAQNIKRGIFWLGKDATIFTKQTNVNEFFGNYNGQNKTDNDLVNINIFESLGTNLMSNSGIMVNISKCYTFGRVLDENNWDNIRKALGNKFAYYLSNNNFGTCKITIYSDLFINKDIGRKVFSNKLDNEESAIFKIGAIDRKIENSQLDKMIDDNLHDLKDEKSFYDFKLKVLNNQKLVFNDEIIFSNNCSLPVKVYMLAKPNIHLAGAAISYKNIWIYYPNKLSDNSGLYTPFNERMDSGRWRWIRIEINLDNLNKETNVVKLNSEKNKLVFNLDTNISKDDFDEIITELFRKWIPYADFIKKLSNLEI